MKFTFLKLVSASVLLAGLVACGGGGTTPTITTPVVSGSAEGIWQGVSATGQNVSLVILETGQAWGIYSIPAEGPRGAVYADITTVGTTISGAGSFFNFSPLMRGNNAYTGSFVSKESITVNANDGTVFKGTYAGAYDKPGEVSAIAGTYAGKGITNFAPSSAVTMTIDSLGKIATNGMLSPSAPGQTCLGSGSLKSRPSGKGVFDVQLTFTGIACAMSLTGDAVTSGVAFIDAVTGQLTLSTRNAAKSDGFLYIGKR